MPCLFDIDQRLKLPCVYNSSILGGKTNVSITIAMFEGQLFHYVANYTILLHSHARILLCETKWLKVFSAIVQCFF